MVKSYNANQKRKPKTQRKNPHDNGAVPTLPTPYYQVVEDEQAEKERVQSEFDQDLGFFER